MNSYETKIRKSYGAIKAALVRKRSWLDSWDDADDYDEVQAIERLVELNATPYGGPVNVAILNVVPEAHWKYAAAIVSDLVHDLDDDALFEWGLEIGAGDFRDLDDDRMAIMMDAETYVWEEIRDDILASYRNRDDVSFDDLPWNVKRSVSGDSN